MAVQTEAKQVNTTGNGTAKKRRRLFSLSIKLLIAFTLLFSVVFAAAYYWFYQFAVNNAITQIQGSLKNALLGASKGVDIATMLALYQTGIPDTANNYGSDDSPVYETTDPRYQAILDWLETVHSIEPRAWPYLYVKGDDPGSVVVIADLWVRHDTNRAYGFNSYYKPSRPNFVLGLDHFLFNTNDDGSFRIYHDEWGNWTTAYGPINDIHGKPVAAIGVDFEAQSVYNVQDAIKNAIIPAFGLTYVILFTMVIVISRVITRPVARLTRIAARIGEGDYNQDLTVLNSGPFQDEIGILAQVFEGMVDKVRQREETLKKEVVQLRVEIDQAKKTQQVAEIVESEFFKDLRDKAALMRNRRGTPSSHPVAGADASDNTGKQPEAPATDLRADA